MTDKVYRIINALDSMKERIKDIDNDYISKLFPENRHINTYRIQKEIEQLIEWIEEEK